MLTPNNQPDRADVLLKDLIPLHHSAREICAGLGIDVVAADRAADRHKGRDFSTLPWLKSPELFASNAKAVLEHEVPRDLNISDSMGFLIEEAQMSTFPQWAYLLAAVTVDHEEWSTASKNAAISLCDGDPMENLQPISYGEGPDSEQRDECEALKAWLVYNTLAVDSMQRKDVSDETKKVLELLLRNEVENLAAVYFTHLQTGEMMESHPLRDVDEILLRLGSKRPEIGALVQMLIESWNNALRTEAGGREQSFEDALSEILPDLVAAPKLEGEVIGRSAIEALQQFAANMAFAKSFGDLVNQPEWGNPFESVRELVSVGLHKINLYTGDDLFSQRSIRIVQQIVQGMDEKPNLIFPSSALGLASADSASIESILDGLREFIATGRRSFADFAGVSTLNAGKLEEVVEALNFLRDLVGSEKIHLVTNSDLNQFVEGGKVERGMLFGDWVNVESVPVIVINTVVREVPDEEVANKARRLLALSTSAWPPILAGAIRQAVGGFVLPSLAQTQGGADQDGCVGFKPLTALEIAERQGLVSPLPRDSVNFAYVLQVYRVSDPDESEALDPVDVDDFSLTS